jgi:hypothetical protein
MRLADECACRAVGLGRHAAGIHHHHVGSKGLALAKGAQISGDRLAIGTRRPATEVLNVKAGHLS